MQTVGGLRLFDGFFVGEQHTARDQQFILLNQITVVINLTNYQIPNYYEHYDITYLNVDWKDIGQRINFAEDVCQVISDNLQRLESVLVHGLYHLDESITICAIFMMHKFRWSLYKTLEYLQTKVNGLIFTPASFNLLKFAELKLLTTEARLSYNWQARPENQRELILRNTFLNCRQRKQNGRVNKKAEIVCQKKKSLRRVSWVIKQKSNAIPQVSCRVQRIKTQQNKIRDHIILSVRKIMAQSANKQNKTAQNFKQLSRTSAKLLAKKLASNEPQISMKKYKSFYSLASLSSFDKLETPSTELTQKNQSSNHKNLVKFANQSYDRIKTEKSQPINQNIASCMIDKTSFVKADTKDSDKARVEIHLTRTHSEQLARKGSFPQKNQKQLSKTSSKISLRKQTPHKKLQIQSSK